MKETTVQLELNERCTRAMHDAVCFTLNQWAGQGELDQEILLYIKPQLQACILEFDFGRDDYDSRPSD